MLSLGFALSLLATAATSAAPAHAAAATCDGAVASAEADIEGDEPPQAATSRLPPALARADYATPAVIDCRLPVVSRPLPALVGECAGVTVPDASYRTSRWPESEMPAGAFAPLRPDARAKVRLTIVAGVPSQPTTALAPPSLQPLALFAVPDVPRPSMSPVFATDEAAPRSALGRRLERPPRA
ncbi:MAG TPA: hypothetical protein VMU50_11900 [Polyangia bacterium]|nr:hypothetical protein [Polyangia bacterium]